MANALGYRYTSSLGALVLALATTPTLAQESSGVGEVAAPQAVSRKPAQAPAASQGTTGATASGAGGDLGDIVVTATRRSESLQRVALAVTALNSDRLAQANVVDLRSVQNLSAGIQIQPQFVPGNAVFSIRGQSNSDSTPTIDPSVGIYFDDVYIARSTGSLVNLVDLERVEVLKGPQGTLFGKNNAGGAIRLISKKPTDKFEGYVKGGYESFDKKTIEAVINVPLSDRAAFRAVGQFVDKSDGYGTNSFNGHPIDTERSYFGRAALRLEPTETINILLQGDYSHTRGGGLVNYWNGFYPSASGGFLAPLELSFETGLTSAQATALLLSLQNPNGTRKPSHDLRLPTSDSFTFNPATGEFTINGGVTDERNFSRTVGVSAHVDWDLGAATLTSITAFRDLKYSATYDLDGLSFHFLDSLQSADAKQFSQELLLNGTGLSDRLKWTLGGLFFRENALQVDRSVAFAALSALGGNAGSLANQRGINTSYGIFAQGTYSLTDALSVTAGVRRSTDKRRFVANAFDVSTGTGTPNCVFTAANGLALLPSFDAPCTLTQSASKSEWSYTGSLQYQIDPDKLVYVRTSRGYRAGGFNARILDPVALGFFQPEVVTDYELGLKTSWFDRRLRANLALFHSRGTGVQSTRSATSATTNQTLTITSNVGTRKVNGVELEIDARPTNFLTLNSGISYLDAKLDNPLRLDETWVPLVPKWSFNLGGTVEAPLSSNYTVKLHGDLTYRGRMFDTQVPVRTGPNDTGAIVAIGKYNPVTLLAARLSVVNRNTGIELAVYGRNLTNKLYNARQASIGDLGFTFNTLAEPRVVGLELKVPFGDAKQ